MGGKQLLRSLDDDAIQANVVEFNEGAWGNNHNGESVWSEPQQFNALFKGKGGKAGKGGPIICNWCHNAGHISNECDDNTKYCKERGICRQAFGYKPRGVANTAEVANDQGEDQEPTVPKWMNTSSANEDGDKGRAGMFKTLEASRDKGDPQDFVVQTRRQGPTDRGVRHQ